MVIDDMVFSSLLSLNVRKEMVFPVRANTMITSEKYEIIKPKRSAGFDNLAKTVEFIELFVIFGDINFQYYFFFRFKVQNK